MLTVQEVLQRVTILLEDDAADIWDRDELVTWLNDAVLSLVNKKPDAYVKRSVVSLVAGTYQSLPDDGMMLIHVVRDMQTHKSITGLPLDILDDQNPSWRQPVLSSNVLHYTYSDKDPKHYEVYPSVVEGVQIEIDYGAVPENVSVDTDTIPIGKEYLNVLVDWVLYRAYSKDDESADLSKATMHLQAFMNALGLKVTTQQAIIPNTRNAVGVQ